MKTKQKSHNFKLSQYSTFAAGFLIAGGAADAQMVFVDIADIELNADYLTNSNNFYDLELTDEPDGQFMLMYNYNRQFYFVDDVLERYTYFQANYFIPPFGGSIIGGMDGFRAMADVLETGDLIGPDNEWINSGGLGYVYLDFYMAKRNLAGGNVDTYRVGDWIGAENKCMGVRFLIDGEKHYGWVRMSVEDIDFNFSTITIQEYAYAEDPETAVLACTTVMPNDEVVDLDQYYDVISFGNKITIINKSSDLNQEICKIYTSSMQEISETILSSSSTTIDLSNIPSGSYFVTIKHDSKILVKQIQIVGG